MKKSVRLIATFCPQVLINDRFLDIDDKEQFDATNAFLSLTNEQIRFFRENDYDSDNLADSLPKREEHNGPFEVDVNINQWLENNGFNCTRNELTDEQIESLRAAFKD